MTTDTKSIKEALEKLEAAGAESTQEVKKVLEEELNKIKSKLSDVSPLFEDTKEKVVAEGKKVKAQVENQMLQNPWLSLGVVALIAFVIGIIFGGQGRDKSS